MIFFAEKKKWKPEIKDSWMTFFSSIVKVMKKSETKAEKENQNDPDEHCEHMTGQYRQVRANFVRGYFCLPSQELKESQFLSVRPYPYVSKCSIFITFILFQVVSRDFKLSLKLSFMIHILGAHSEHTLSSRQSQKHFVLLVCN